MREGLQQLLNLQEVDKELEELENSKSQYPAEINERKEEIDAAGKNLLLLEEEKSTWEKKQRQSEGEIELAKESLKVHEDRFSVVTNNREYDALQGEIQACKTTLSERESQLLEAMESVQRLEGEIENEKNAFDEIRQSQQQRIDELQNQLDSMQELVDGVEARRKEATKTIESNMLLVYEKRRGPRSRRVASIKKNACGICFRQLPPQQLSEVKRSEHIVHCENCSAIMVWDDNTE